MKDVRCFVDPEYLPDYDTLDSEPSHLSMAKVKKLLRYWLSRQESGDITFRFHYVLDGSEKVLGKVPKVGPIGSPSKGPKKARKTRAKSKKSVPTTVMSNDDDDLDSTATVQGSKKSRKRPGKAKVQSRAIIEESGEEFDFQGVDNGAFSDDEPNIPTLGGSPPLPSIPLCTGTSGGTSPSQTTPGNVAGNSKDEVGDWRKAPATLQSSDIDLWKAFVKKLPESCSDWSHDQRIIQFQVFKGWSAVEKKEGMASTISGSLGQSPAKMVDIRKPAPEEVNDGPKPLIGLKTMDNPNHVMGLHGPKPWMELKMINHPEHPDMSKAVDTKLPASSKDTGNKRKETDELQPTDKGQKRLREDGEEGPTSVGATKLPSPKRLKKLPDDSPKQKPKPRPIKKKASGAQPSNESGPSVAVTRSKSKLQNTRRNTRR